MKKFTWTVEFTIDETWVADGFCLTDERAHDMITNALPYAYGHEVSVKVVKSPDRVQVLKAFGCTPARIKKALSEMPNADVANPFEIFDFLWGK